MTPLFDLHGWRQMIAAKLSQLPRDRMLLTMTPNGGTWTDYQELAGLCEAATDRAAAVLVNCLVSNVRTG